MPWGSQIECTSALRSRIRDEAGHFAYKKNYSFHLIESRGERHFFRVERGNYEEFLGHWREKLYC